MKVYVLYGTVLYCWDIFKDVVVIDVYLLAGSSGMRWWFLKAQIQISVSCCPANILRRNTLGVIISNLSWPMPCFWNPKPGQRAGTKKNEVAFYLSPISMDILYCSVWYSGYMEWGWENGVHQEHRGAGVAEDLQPPVQLPWETGPLHVSSKDFSYTLYTFCSKLQGSIFM